MNNSEISILTFSQAAQKGRAMGRSFPQNSSSLVDEIEEAGQLDAVCEIINAHRLTKQGDAVCRSLATLCILRQELNEI
jgi:hypothetical protein